MKCIEINEGSNAQSCFPSLQVVGFFELGPANLKRETGPEQCNTEEDDDLRSHIPISTSCKTAF